MKEKEIKIFDNHKIPRKLRGKPLIGEVFKDKGFRYCSDDSRSKSGREELYIFPKGDRICGETIYLKPSEYSLRDVKS